MHSNQGRKIKVVQVIADSAPGGGPSHVLGLLKHLDKQRFECFLICPSGYLAREAKKIAAVEVINLPFRSKFDLWSLWQFNRILQQIRVKGDPFGSMIVHSHGSRAGLAARWRRLTLVKYIYTEHRFDADFHLKNSLNEKVQLWLLGVLNHKTDWIVAVSTSVANFLLKNNLAPPGRLTVIPNAIEAERIKPPNLHSFAKAPVIGTIGNLNTQKGHCYLIKAFDLLSQKYPESRLEIVGGGDQEDNIKYQISNIKNKKGITLLGRREEPEKFLKKWDVFVLPSVAEAFGIVLLEAMAAGVPIVAANVGGIPDIIENNKNGVLVPPRQPEALAKAIGEILDNQAKARELSRRGLARVQVFTWPKIISRFHNLYFDTLAG
ncbi:MAG: glycosyltransferase family 4 protein [Patescibacteria group bacterium]